MSTSPIGIDPARFREKLASDGVNQELQKLENAYEGLQVILGVDRLDYTKGIPQKLLAFEKLLVDHPELVGKVVLIQVAVPTRSGVMEYIKLQQQVEGLVGRVNGRHGTPTYTPVRYLHRSIPFEMLTALYALADVCMISPIRDGLNLVSYEYVASQAYKRPGKRSGAGPGVLALSQYTGAATTLKTALMFNPWDCPRAADALFTALTMEKGERERRHAGAIQVVESQTSARWGEKFLHAMETLSVKDEKMPNDMARSDQRKEDDFLQPTKSRQLDKLAPAEAKR
jgi:trehalose-6-phosphate synthase